MTPTEQQQHAAAVEAAFFEAITLVADRMIDDPSGAWRHRKSDLVTTDLWQASAARANLDAPRTAEAVTIWGDFVLDRVTVEAREGKLHFSPAVDPQMVTIPRWLAIDLEKLVRICKPKVVRDALNTVVFFAPSPGAETFLDRLESALPLVTDTTKGER